MREASCSTLRMRVGLLVRGLDRSRTPQLRVAADRRERRAQLVRRVRDETPEPILRLLPLLERTLDLAEHRVQGDAELPDLGLLLGGRNAARQVAVRDRVRGHRHLLDGAHAVAQQPPRRHAQREQHSEGGRDLDRHDLAIGVLGRCAGTARPRSLRRSARPRSALGSSGHPRPRPRSRTGASGRRARRPQAAPRSDQGAAPNRRSDRTRASLHGTRPRRRAR